MAEPSFISLYECLERIAKTKKLPRLRFILLNKARLDFFFFPESNKVHLHYREPKHSNVYLGQINSEGKYTPILDQYNTYKQHTGALLNNLMLDFARAITSYGRNYYLCALCGNPLIDPASLARGTTPNCAVHLLTPASLNDITG